MEVHKIKKIKFFFDEYDIDGYIINSSDEFNNEYVPNHLKRLQYITNFTGSNGIAVITANSCALFTDGRYTAQAKRELPIDFEVLDIKEFMHNAWFDQFRGYTFGIDSKIITQHNFKLLNGGAKLKGINIKPIDNNLVDKIWLDKPFFKESNIIHLPVALSGLESTNKIKQVLEMLPSNVDYLLLTSLDSIAWLLNIRANDIEYTPYLLAYLLMDKYGSITLFTDPGNIIELDIRVIDIDQFHGYYLDLIENDTIVAMDDKRTASWFFNANTVTAQDPCYLLKTIKNITEIEGFKAAHIEDAIALLKFMHWLRSGVDEFTASKKLLEFRSIGKYFQYPSFATISAFKENGAIIHYKPSQDAKTIDSSGLYLIDSGGQYLNGTTDVTRVMCLGQATSEQIKAYTLVLKGHINLMHARFPIGTKGLQLDALARVYLWQSDMNYPHGTGHGVGHFGCVHEGPASFSSDCVLVPGMVISNEPGYYVEGEYGIRIENMMFVKKSSPGFLEFENLTLVPYELKLIDRQLLSDDEINWINQYHETIYSKLCECLSDDLKTWLRQKITW